MKNALLAATVIAIAVSNASAQYVATTQSERLNQMMIRRAVVKIHDVTDLTSGTGFVVHEDARGKYVLTNAHVAEDGHKLELDLYPHGSIDASAKVEVLARDAKRDLALLRIKADNATGILELRRRRDRRLDEVPALLAGFPDGKLKIEKIGVVEDSVLTGRFAGRFCHLKKRFGAGGSGSPVICFRGGSIHVVGVYQGYTTERGVACYQIESFLDANGYSDVIDAKPSDEETMTLFKVSLSIVVEELERSK